MPNEGAKIILAATHGKLTKVRDALIVEGTINALKMEFQFRTTDWDGTIKTAVFVRGRATPSTPSTAFIHVMLDENNECDVPPEILAPNGYFSVGVFGVAVDHTIPSNWMYYRAADGCYTAGGNTPIDTTPSLYAQILEILKNKSSIDHNHDDVYFTKLESDERYIKRGGEIGTIESDVTSVNNKKGAVVLNAEDVGAFANITQQTEIEIYNDSIKNGDTQHDSLGLVEGRQYKVDVTYNRSGTLMADTIIATARYSAALQCVAVPNRNDEDYESSGMTDPGNDGFAIGDTVTHVNTNWFNQFKPVSVKLYALEDVQVPTIPYSAIIDPVIQAQPDWNQNDETAIDYIRNRPFGDEIHATDISGATYTITGFNSGVLTVTHEPIPLRLGQVWAVRSNNESNDRILSVQESENGELYLGTLAVNDVPFCIKSTETTINASYRSQMGVSRFMLTCVSGVITSTYVKQVEQKFVPNADWSQNDENGNGYIKNRTHWEEERINEVVLIDNVTLDNFEDTESGFYRQYTDYYIDFENTIGQTYFVIWDGVEYECVCDGIVEDFGIGNANIMGSYGSKTSEPFALHHSSSEDSISVSIKDNGSHTLSVIQRSTSTEVHHIDPKYIKDMYYENITEEILVDNLTYEAYDSGNCPQCTFILGDTYNVICGGTLYENVVCSEIDGWRVLGGAEGYPFYIDDDGGDALYIDAMIEDFPVSVTHVLKDLNKLDAKYLPDNVATIEYVDSQITQPDWTQNDSNSPDYIKNRTHYYSQYYPEGICSVGEIKLQEVDFGIHPLMVITKPNDFKNHFQYDLIKNMTYAVLHRRMKLRSYTGYEVESDMFGEDVNSMLSLIDSKNYKMADSGNLEIYFIVDLNTLTDEYKDMFAEIGVYLHKTEKCAAMVYSYMLEFVKFTQLSKRYIPSTFANADVAEAGQVLSVKEVDRSGKPTKWEAVDLPSTEVLDVSSEAALEIVIKTGLVNPTSDENGAIYTDENGLLYTL